MHACPKCQSLCTVPVAYGKPGEDLLRAADRGLVRLAGCAMDASSPTQHCLDCGASWRIDADPGALLSMARDGFALIRKHQHQLDRLMDEYGAACVAYGASSRDASDASQAFSAMMASHAQILLAWNDFFANTEAIASRNYFHGMPLRLNEDAF